MWEAEQVLRISEELASSPAQMEAVISHQQRAMALLKQANLPEMNREQLEAAIQSMEDLQMASKRLTTILLVSSS